MEALCAHLRMYMPVLCSIVPVYLTRISTVWGYLSVVTVMSSLALHICCVLYCGEMTSYHIVMYRTLYHIMYVDICFTYVRMYLTSCRFAALCENAYLILRRQGYLFITLFAMMLQTGVFMDCTYMLGGLYVLHVQG